MCDFNRNLIEALIGEVFNAEIKFQRGKNWLLERKF